MPLVGWSHARALARVCEAHIITQVRNRDAFLRAGMSDEAFTAIDSEKVARRVWRVSRALGGGVGGAWTLATALQSVSYRYFEKLLWRRFGDRLKKGEFDLVHRITPLSPTIPSPLAKRCAQAGVPFVLGPLNGGLPWPKGFEGARWREREWLSYARWAHRLFPSYWSTLRRASAIVVGSQATWSQLPRAYRRKSVYIPENGIDRARVSSDQPREEASDPPRIVFIGRLVPYKGMDILIRACASLLSDGRARLEVIGNGPEMERLRAIAASEGVADKIEFTGWLEHREAQRRLGRCDIFAFPSIREFGGGVVLEAMALGLAPVVVDYGGPAELVTEHTGCAIPLGTREQLVERFRQRLTRLVEHPQEAKEMGRRARERVMRKFTWEAKAAQVLEVYRWVLGEREQKPDFGMPIADEPHPPGAPTAEASAAL